MCEKVTTGACLEPILPGAGTKGVVVLSQT
jgi:hypothetical protein